MSVMPIIDPSGVVVAIHGISGANYTINGICNRHFVLPGGILTVVL